MKKFTKALSLALATTMVILALAACDEASTTETNIAPQNVGTICALDAYFTVPDNGCNPGIATVVDSNGRFIYYEVDTMEFQIGQEIDLSNFCGREMTK